MPGADRVNNVTGTACAERTTAIAALNRPLDRVAISLLRSQTIDLFAAGVAPDLRQRLAGLRTRAPDGVKVPVRSIDRDGDRDGDGYRVVLDDDTLFIADADCGGFRRTLGGGLCNLSRDLAIILEALRDRLPPVPPLDILTWADAAGDVGGTAVPGRSRVSLILQDREFDKLILTERGSPAIDPWEAERRFYGPGDGFVFIGQEPDDSKKFEHIRRLKLDGHAARVFWLVGGNQLRRLYTEYRDVLSVVDVVSMNLAEAAGFFGFEPLRRKHRDAGELRRMYAREISRRVLEYGAGHVVITDGAKGASLARKARGGRVEFVHSPFLHENVIEVDRSVREDTGCGDAFAAAVAAYFLGDPDGFKLNEAANFAHYVAGIVHQRPRPSLTRDDLGFVAFAHTRAQGGAVFGGAHETFARNACQIRPAEITRRGRAGKVLVLLLGDDPSDASPVGVSGARAAFEGLARLCREGRFALAPLVRLIPRLTTDPGAGHSATMEAVERDEMDRLIGRGLLCKELGNLDSGVLNGVRKADLQGPDGVYLLRTGLIEALEVLSSEDFAALFGDIKFWHFAMEDVAERLLWYTQRKIDIGAARSGAIMRESLRDYVIRDLKPQYRFAHAGAATLDAFEGEMTEHLVLRLNALLAGIFRHHDAG